MFTIELNIYFYGLNHRLYGDDYLYHRMFLFPMYLYLQLLSVFGIIPTIILLYLNRKKIHLKTLCVSLCVLFFIAVLWDQLSVRMELWTFSQDQMVGNILGLPVEEYLFFIFVPLLCINIYLFIEEMFRRQKNNH
ncbi:MAG: hypothetical protein BV458_02255 [Thermoplasmata archaeon M9B2D]|nr:MAG: hypothetical protein BV458_02255 [Thermoplasmata archaeon M9B2D]